MSLGHPAGVPAKRPFSVNFSTVNNRKSLGHRPVDPCLSRRVSLGHPAGVPAILLKFMCPFLSWKILGILWQDHAISGILGVCRSELFVSVATLQSLAVKKNLFLCGLWAVKNFEKSAAEKFSSSVRGALHFRARFRSFFGSFFASFKPCFVSI